MSVPLRRPGLRFHRELSAADARASPVWPQPKTASPYCSSHSNPIPVSPGLLESSSSSSIRCSPTSSLSSHWKNERFQQVMWLKRKSPQSFPKIQSISEVRFEMSMLEASRFKGTTFNV